MRVRYPNTGDEVWRLGEIRNILWTASDDREVAKIDIYYRVGCGTPFGKKRAHLDNLEIKLEGEEAKEHPRVFNKIDVNCVFYGKDLKEEDIKWAVERSYEKYCPVGAMLAEAVDINYSWEIVNL